MDIIVFYLLLYILAAVCFFAYALGGTIHPRLNLLGFGVFFWALVPLTQTLLKL